ncbi:hypothetical protein [Consotaella aegiceratis]|uniref:hypothetical protein n=1 Tax=Consotaella aegiceratis TaxID=3097961 RepID=UPI002F3FD781
MSKRDKAAELLERFGTPFSWDLGIDLAQNTPEPLFRWLNACVLFSARISADLALQAAKALGDAGLTGADKIAASSWEDRVRVLNRNGYARYDESTSRYLGEDAALCLERYDGDLRKLRDAADRDPDEERKLLKEFKGIGDVGVDIFFREAQVAWDELYPFADKRSLQAAAKLGLGEDAKTLAGLVNRDELPALLTALVKADLAKELDEISKT